MEQTDIIIIGAGVVGLALARTLSDTLPASQIVVLEQHDRFGRETSSRNSEVIHAGIYYPENSLKAALCVDGRRALYDFCREFKVPYRRTEKLIVATDTHELPTLDSLLIQGQRNNVADLQLLDQDQTRRLEPAVNAVAALHSPATGIVDSHQLMARLEWCARRNGVVLAYRHQVRAIDPAPPGATVLFCGPDGTDGQIGCRWLINSAGLQADRLAAGMGIDIDAAGYRLHPCKGEYFRLSARHRGKVSRLIYPTPYADLRGLGVHLTLDLAGQARLGPNATYVDTIDYDVDPAHANDFYTGASRFLPFVQPTDLHPDTAGIRPKLQAPGEPLRDFIIRHEHDRGLDGIINLVGIESPGLTACLAIARQVADQITHAR